MLRYRLQTTDAIAAGDVPLDELLADEVMQPVMRSAGRDRVEFKQWLDELAHRLAGRRPA